MLEDFCIISKAVKYLDQHYYHEMKLEELSIGIGVPYSKCERLFRRWSNTGSHELLKCLAKKNYREAISNKNSSILQQDYDYQEILDNKSQFAINLRIMHKNSILDNKNTTLINYQFFESRFGRCLIGLESDRICWFSFVDNDKNAIQTMQHYFSGVRLTSASITEGSSIDSLLIKYKKKEALPLSLFGNVFQTRVLSALLKIPMGSCVSYGMLALNIGNAKSARAVGNAIGNNPISYLIPCHRVIRNSGLIGGYRWNANRKRIILAWECIQMLR